ncbi:RelA/SpoT domain-containing protein [Metabacillus fastidiosus]|uniref:RelA/SpoT domain-containing protein n=1 Tax=Metabacillus fastidiosus TaxID=1458 RepID=UPI003D28E304
MTIINEFLERYEKEYDFYQEAARVCSFKCEKNLENSGIRAIVSHRAKRPDRLREKLEKRNEQKNYSTVEEIYADIVDLAGVRIALYFPGDQDEIQRLIDNLFMIQKTKNFLKKENQYLHILRDLMAIMLLTIGCN